MVETHDRMLVAMSIVIAIAASYTALDLAGRIRASAGGARRAWLATAAVAMGGGIWAMHFVAMLAHRMPGMTVRYDPAITFASLLVAILVTGVGFAMMARAAGERPALAAAGLVMGLGVVVMHYMGMAAMRMPAVIAYDPAWVALSVVIAIGAATAALWLASRRNDLLRRLAAAGVMGLAIAGMHFSGMRAATFTMLAGAPAGTPGLAPLALATIVSAATLLILFLALIAAMFDRRFALLAAREAETLRLSEERFRKLYRGTPLPLHSLTADGRLEQVSDAWLRMTGYRRNEVIGRRFIDFLEPESARRAAMVDRPTLWRDGEVIDCAYRLVTRNGDLRDVLASARIDRMEDGGVLHIVGGLTDVTERKRAEAALHQAQKIEAIGQLTGGIAHDFNNLLAVIVGNLDLLDRHVAGEPRARRLLDNAKEGARRGASLTQRLLAFARRQDLRPEMVDVAALVGGMADMLTRSIGPLVRIETCFPPHLPPAHVDPHQLELALLNMAVNARDAMPEGGTLTIAAAEEEREDGRGRLRLDIADTGTGMDTATLARASEPFFTTKGVGKGTGLGLSMVQGLAAQSGGHLAIDSRLGAGTRISLWLPLARGRPCVAGAGVAAVEAFAPPPRLSILVVDDDDLVRGNTAAMLEAQGHEVLTAASGAGALALLAGDAPIDMVVTDQLMPQMTGLRLAEAIRRDRPHMPILLVTGFAELDGGEAAVDERLHKPFDMAALAAAVARVWQAAAPRTAMAAAG